MGLHAQLETYPAHLILKQKPERLTQAQVHLLRQPAHVVVTLDGHTRDGKRLNDVGVDGSLRQPLYILQLMCFLVEYIDKPFSNNLPFTLRISHSLQLLIEMLLCIHTDNVES